MDDILERIYKSGLKLLVPFTLEECYAIITQEAVKLVGGEYGSIALRQEGEFKRVYTTSPIIYKSKIRKKAYAYKAFIERRAILVSSSKTTKAHPELKELGIRNTIHIPLSYKNQSIGVLIVNSRNQQQFGKEELTILKYFGSFASLAIRKAQLYDETKKALGLRDHFISMAAHELRTPLTSVNGYVQLLYSKLSGGESSESRWVEHLYQESIRLTNLVNELLEINRIKSGQLKYAWKECSLREIINRSLGSLKFVYPDRKIVFEDQLEGKSDLVIGDFDKILQVISNVIENALKFSPHHSEVKINLKLKSKNFIISIKDQGIGIDKKDIPKLYEGYFKAGNNPAKEGMGLGLFLVKDILQRHRGSVNIRSKVDKGTTFEIKFPKAKI